MANLMTESAAFSRGQRRLEAPRRATQNYPKTRAEVKWQTPESALGVTARNRMIAKYYSLANT
jgi:hypothetical protein